MDRGPPRYRFGSIGMEETAREKTSARPLVVLETELTNGYAQRGLP